MEVVSMAEMVDWTLNPCGKLCVFAYRAKYNEWSIALLEGSKKEACPSPENIKKKHHKMLSQQGKLVIYLQS
jgi:hypothetical protein